MGLLSRRLKYNCERGGHVKEQEKYIAIYVGMEASDLKLITAILFLIILVLSNERKRKVKTNA